MEKHKATGLMMLRTEVLGLNDWLHKIGVPGVRPECPCGARRQTLRHIIAFCPLQIQPRLELLERTGQTDPLKLINGRKTAKAAVYWLISTGTMEQFRVAVEVSKESQQKWRPVEAIQEWDTR